MAEPALAVTNSTAMTVMSASPSPSRSPVKIGGQGAPAG